MKSLFAIFGMIFLSPITIVLLLITLHLFGEARYIPSVSMQPTLKANDRVIIEKISTYLNRPYTRGEIILFYPPPIELNGQDLHSDIQHVLGRLTGLPFLPSEPAFIKRVVGLPGDHIRIVAGNGVYVNGKRLDESTYLTTPVSYSLNVLGDIGGLTSQQKVTRPYQGLGNEKSPIIVPPDGLFVLGDDRNNSDDSHVFGMLKTNRVIGRVQIKYSPEFQIIK